MRPWQDTQPTPALTWDACSKYAKSGTSWMRIQAIGRPLDALSRIGCRSGESFFASVCQFMQTCVGGTPAAGDTSTIEWQ